MTSAAPSYKRHRYPVEIIDHGVWLYFRFTLSFRGVEEMMLARGVVVSYETIRRWCAKFGPLYAAKLRRRRPGPGTDQRPAAVPVAGGGPERHRARHPDPVASKREGRHEVLPQAPEGTALGAQGDRDR